MSENPDWVDGEIGDPPDPTVANSDKEAVFIGQQVTGNTVIVGREDTEEWLFTNDMVPLEVEEYR